MKSDAETLDAGEVPAKPCYWARIDLSISKLPRRQLQRPQFMKDAANSGVASGAGPFVLPDSAACVNQSKWL